MYEGKIKLIEYQGRELRFLNQCSRNWTHPYPYGENDDSTLSSAGCGIFSIAHVVEWFTGKRMKPESLADFSVENGGRGDDGTDRPALLGAMMAHGYAGQCGFSYQLDGLRNDLEALWEHMRAGNAALCNLRVGHIVALVDARETERGREYLVIDSYSESAHEKVKNAVREVVEEGVSELMAIARWAKPRNTPCIGWTRTSPRTSIFCTAYEHGFCAAERAGRGLDAYSSGASGARAGQRIFPWAARGQGRAGIAPPRDGGRFAR